MGRHSVPDEPDDDVPDDTSQRAAAVAVRERDTRGRHSRSDEDAPPRDTDLPEDGASDVATLKELIGVDNDVTERIPPIVDDVAAPASRPAPVTAPVATAPPPGHAVLRGAAHNSAADLSLVRSHRGVLAACAAAVLLPFVVEIVVLIVLGTVDGHSVLVWLWAPLVVAGVLLGVTLDIAHRRTAAVSVS